MKKRDFVAAEGHLKRALAEVEKSETAEREQAETLYELAIAYHCQAKFENAEPLYRRGLAIREKLAGPNRVESVDFRLNLAIVCRALKKYDEAAELFDQAQKILELKYDKFHPVVAHALLGKALTYESKGNLEKAEKFFNKALAQADVSRTEMQFKQLYDPAVYAGTWIQSILRPNYEVVASIADAQGRFFRRQGRLDEAEAAFRRLLKIVDEEMKRSGAMQGMAPCLLAEVLILKTKMTEADALLERVLEPRTGKGRPPPEVPGLFLATAWGLKMQVQVQAKQFPEGMRSLQQLLAQKMDVKPTTALASVANLRQLAGNYYWDHATDIADALLRSAAEVTRETLGKTDVEREAVLVLQGEFFLQTKRHTEAEKVLRQAAALHAETPPKPTGARVLALRWSGELAMTKGDYAAAAEYLERGLAAEEKLAGRGSRLLIPYVNLLTKAYQQLNQSTPLGPLYERIIEIKQAELGADHVDVADAHAKFGQHLLEMQDDVGAERHLVQAYKIEMKARGEDNMLLLSSINRLTRFYRIRGRDAELEPLYRRQVLIFEGLYGPKHSVLNKPLADCAAVLRKLKRDAEAEQLEARIRGLDPAK